MSEIKPGTTTTITSAPTGPDQSFSLEDLDRMLEVEDPGFKASLESIQTDRNTTDTSIESLDVEVDGASEDVTDKKGPKVQIIFGKITAPIKRLNGWFHLRRISYANQAKIMARQTFHFIRHDLPDLIRYVVAHIKTAVAWVRAWTNRFINLPTGKKILLMGSGLSSFLALFFLLKALSGQWLPIWRSPLIHSLAEKSKKTFSVKKEDMIPFFDAFPEVEFHLLLSKMIVNLTPSPSIPNPMGAFEFYLGLDSNETAIEIKDREKEVIDITQRTLEEFAYEEVNSPVGLTRIKARIRDNINHILNQGRVQKVYVKTLITYRQ